MATQQLTQAENMATLGMLMAGIAHDIRNPIQAVRDLTGGRGADIAIEAVGKPETWGWAVEMLRRGGTVNFFGGCPNETRVDLDTNLLHYSELTCKASFHHTPRLVKKALDAVAQGDRVDDPVLTVGPGPHDPGLALVEVRLGPTLGGEGHADQRGALAGREPGHPDPLTVGGLNAGSVAPGDLYYAAIPDNLRKREEKMLDKIK